MKTSTLAPVTALLAAALACSCSIPTVQLRQDAASHSQLPTGRAKEPGDAADEPQLKVAGSGSAWPVIPALDRGVRTTRAVAEPISISNESPSECAGSVDITRVRAPPAAARTAVAAATVVLPTPPLPVKRRTRTAPAYGRGPVALSPMRPRTRLRR